jgi:hypothetical protein
MPSVRRSCAQQTEIDKNWCFVLSVPFLLSTLQLSKCLCETLVPHVTSICLVFGCSSSVAVVSHTCWCLSSTFLLSFCLSLKIRMFASSLSSASLRQPVSHCFCKQKYRQPAMGNQCSGEGGGKPAIPEEPPYRGQLDANRQEHDSLGEDDCLVTTALVVCHRKSPLSRVFSLFLKRGSTFSSVAA